MAKQMETGDYLISKAEYNEYTILKLKKEA